MLTLLNDSPDRHIVVDIETAPLELTDKDVVDYLIRKQTTVNNPIFSKIIVVGVKELGKKLDQFYGDDEKKILEDFWVYVAKCTKIITFNGYGFDVPFIYVRSRINHVIPTVRIPTYKYGMEESSHFDCMLALSHLGIFTWVSLDILCKMHGIPVPEDRISGERMADLYRKRDWESILKHNEGCLEHIEKLYKKCCTKIVPVHVSPQV